MEAEELKEKEANRWRKLFTVTEVSSICDILP